MSKEGLNPYQAQEKRIAFIEKVVGEGILDKIPVNQRDQNIGLIYNLNEELSGEKVAEIYPNPSGKRLTKARIYQIRERFLKESWIYASLQLQAFHPLEELLARKPHALGETASRVKSVVEQGITDPKQIADASDISHSQLGQLRKTLKERGIDIPQTTKSTIKETFEKIGKANDDEKLQELLNSFPTNSLIGFFGRDPSHKTLTTVAVIARKKGFRFHNRQVRFIAARIKEAKIPIREIVRKDKNGEIFGSYFVVLAKQADIIAEALENDPSLQRFR